MTVTREEFEVMLELARRNNQLLVNVYYLLFGCAALLFAMLFSKIVMHRRLYEQGPQLKSLLTEVTHARNVAEATEHQAVLTAVEVKEEVQKVPKEVVKAMAEAGQQSNPDGTLPRPPLPPPS